MRQHPNELDGGIVKQSAAACSADVETRGDGALSAAVGVSVAGDYKLTPHTDTDNEAGSVPTSLAESRERDYERMSMLLIGKLLNQDPDYWQSVTALRELSEELDRLVDADPKTLARVLAHQVPVLRALFTRLTLSASAAIGQGKPLAVEAYTRAALATHRGLAQSLGALAAAKTAGKAGAVTSEDVE